MKKEFNGVRVYQKIFNIGKICVGVFDVDNQKDLDKNIKPLFGNREVEYIKF